MAIGTMRAPDGTGTPDEEERRAFYNAMNEIERTFRDVTYAIVQIAVHEECPASGRRIDGCSKCQPKQIKGLFIGTKPHRHQLAGMINALPNKIFDALRKSFPLDHKQ